MSKEQNPQAKNNWLKKLKLGVGIALTLAVAIIIAQNTVPVVLRAFWAELQVSLALLLGLTFLIGGICGVIAALWPKSKKPKN